VTKIDRLLLLLEWRKINAPTHVQEWMEHGVLITIGESPTPFELSNPDTVSRHGVFITEEIQRLISIDAVDVLLSQAKLRFANKRCIKEKKVNFA
jgi:hypothetical protein